MPTIKNQSILSIIDLRDGPQYLETLARWHQHEWSHLNPGESLQQRIERMQACLGDTFIPSMFIAKDKTLLGSAAIVANDMHTRTDLSPWLASVYVDPEYRNNGIGTKLVQHIMMQCRRHGIKTLYLFTPDQQAFYEKLGWKTIDEESYHDQQVTVMKIDLGDK